MWALDHKHERTFFNHLSLSQSDAHFCASLAELKSTSSSAWKSITKLAPSYSQSLQNEVMIFLANNSAPTKPVNH